MKFACPLSQNTLSEEVVDYQLPGIRIDRLYVDHLSGGFYPKINGVIYLCKKFFHLEELLAVNVSDLSKVVNKDSLDWYAHYQSGFAKFKYDFFVDKFKKRSKTGSLSVLDFISADGNLIRKLKESSGNDMPHHFVALDLDFDALANLHLKDPDVICICCDATKKCFADNQFDLIFSNSMHHIPQDFELAINNIIRVMRKNGAFYGIESQGIFAKVFIKILSFTPSAFVPYMFTEIYKERTLLADWLNTSLQKRCKNICSYQQIQRRLFHVIYKISPKGL